VKVGVYALLMSSVGLVAAHLSHAQSLDFSPWALHTSAPDGNSVCYAASQLVNSTRGIEVRVASTNDGNVGMILRESEWDTQPDEVSTIVKVTFYTDKLEQYSQRFRASKKGQSIVFGFGPTESGVFRADAVRDQAPVDCKDVRGAGSACSTDEVQRG